eukprot:CAMPEP_0202832258 /NCGR_PEP_ID=MMETSP1389-20130828/17464_1 /ASSEMBLY_ACC=CAM_ASM_000865 /TAXON_ID=302021 /ORGANISM="Rhodomonas sp., Strain CCMP768" /LENGTH=42 /DNA_ID= /DNA_START= /DNA_END= /DNA_ORIENTATION=
MRASWISHLRHVEESAHPRGGSSGHARGGVDGGATTGHVLDR